MRIAVCLTRTTTAITLVLMVAGCSEPPPKHLALGVLTAPVTADDSPPADAGVSSLDPGSSRFLTDAAGLRFFTGVETSDVGSGTCLVVVAPGHGQSAGGCDLNDGEGVGAPYIAFGVEARLVADDADVRSYIENGWDQPHPNLILRED